MARVLKIHLLRFDEQGDKNMSLCGIITENSTDDPESVTCQHCSGFYRTNMEWYSQVKNKAVSARELTGEGDLYTRLDVEVGLARIGWEGSAIRALLDHTNIFRNVPIPGDRSTEPDPWEQSKMGVRGR